MDARRKQHQLKLSEINAWIGKLEERDTEQQAFVHLIQIMPKLTSAQAYDMYTRLERNKDPIRSSTREDIVLLMAALCKEHPVASARFLKKMIAYLNYRLRDKRQKVTDACVKAVDAITLYVLPSLPQINISILVQPFLKETNVMSDGAAKCIGALMRPSTADANDLRDHATRIHSYLCTFVPLLVSRFHSAVHATYSPIFYILTEVLRLAKDTQKDMQDLCAASFADMVAAVDATVQFGQRDDWLNRRRGMDMLVACLQCFPHHPDLPHLVLTLAHLAEKGRSDYASPVRESAAMLQTLLVPYKLDGSGAKELSMTEMYAAAHPRAPPSSPQARPQELPSPKRKTAVAPRDPEAFKQMRDDRLALVRASAKGGDGQYDSDSESKRTAAAAGNQEGDLLASDDFAQNVKVAMEEGNMELALRIALLSEDKTLVRRWLLFSQPSVQFLRESTLNALCAGFLDFLETADDAALIFPWISCMLRDEAHLEHVDPRVLRHMEGLLADLSVLPTKDGLVAARLHHELETLLTPPGM
ncbi:Aste57867_13127 [Aphanomyces stellatus]|uniref:Aste57867_13127 protein n=1 Tax=Aphanomyces stellatus TaxID=120398 RepID=A0A485KXB5_9STRA|nr:hypothetical protein As57867_013078 [Aphanomyces stellatus]VFT89969.1 Aste57867_13127 [Aphanomyces stellatus]